MTLQAKCDEIVIMMSPNDSPNAVRPSRSQRRALRTHRRLMDAALAVFSEKGIDGTTIEDVTERADLGKGTFYRHFEGKERILIALVERAVGQLLAGIRDVKEAPNSLESVLEHLTDAHVDFFMTNYNEFVLLFQGRLMFKLQRDTGEELETPFVEYLETLQNLLAPFVPQKMGGQKIRRLAYALAGSVSGLFSLSMIGMAQEELENNMKPIRKVFVTAASAFLKQ